jgi:hypothetical protein
MLSPAFVRYKLVFGLALAGAVVIACTSDRPNAADQTGYAPPIGGTQCDHPNPGCPCDVPGLTADCGRVESRTGDVVLCAEGTTTCDGAHWAACDTVGGQVETHAISGGGLHIAAGSVSTSCDDDNPCDPYCNEFEGDALGLCAGPQLCVGGGKKDGKNCKDNNQCKEGGNLGVCTQFFGVCLGGPKDRNACNAIADCPGGVCAPGNGECHGGTNKKDLCVQDSQCPGPGGHCKTKKCNGLGISDGGVIVLPDSGAVDGGSPGSVLTTPNGNSTCGPAANVHAVGCTVATQYTDCGQDFRCDAGSLQCVWNGASGYFDPTVVGVDLTVGAACDNGPGPKHIPICNRGAGTVPAGTVVGVNLMPGPPGAVPNGCNPIGPPDCTVTAPVCLIL